MLKRRGGDNLDEFIYHTELLSTPSPPPRFQGLGSINYILTLTKLEPFNHSILVLQIFVYLLKTTYYLARNLYLPLYLRCNFKMKITRMATSIKRKAELVRLSDKQT